MNSVRSLSESLSERKRAVFIGALRGVLRVTEKIKTEKDSKKFSFLTRLEGQLMSRALISLISDEYLETPQYTELIKVIIRLGRAGNSLDSFCDLPVDYSKDEVKIKPTFRNRLRLLKGSFGDACYLLKNIKLSRRLAGQLKWVIVTVAENNSEKSTSISNQD